VRAFTVADLMTERVFCVDEGEDAATAHALLESRRLRHFPVCNARGELVGIVSAQDLLAAGRGTQRVRDVMEPAHEWVSPQENVPTAATRLLDNDRSCLPIVEGKTLVGIVTQADFVRFVADSAEESEDELAH